ncbi:MAG: host attachment protein [Nitrospirae bacterium]|nr:host attachment protein [Nitrospirota bacterium]
MEKLIITVDLGHFKAYKVTKNDLESPRIQLIESYDSIEAHGKLSDKVTDTSGRFGMGGGKNGAAKGYGEPHNMELEMEKKAARLIAKDINTIVKREGAPKWYLAASKMINSQILDNLESGVKAKLDRNITSNLTKTDKTDIMKHFESA